MKRRLVLLLPVAAAALTTSVALSGGCGWDYAVVAENTDGEPDFGSDGGAEAEAGCTASDATFTFPDGRVCTGHDEDGDGVPDECDNCPNVANPEQSGGTVGATCAPPMDIIAAPARLLFDPFTSLGSWQPAGSGAGVFQLGGDCDSLAGGDSTSEDLPFVTGMTGAGASAVVVTTTMTITAEGSSGGTAGVILRVNGDPKKFYLCAVSTRFGFALARTPDGGCTGGLCAPLTLQDKVGDASVAEQFPIPSDVPHKIGDVIGVRASVTASEGDAGASGKFECRVFDPKNPATLTSTDTKYVASSTRTGAQWYPSGEVGLYAQRARAVFGSIDVLRGP